MINIIHSIYNTSRYDNFICLGILIKFIFNIVFYLSPISIFNSILLLGYATVYTFLPVL